MLKVKVFLRQALPSFDRVYTYSVPERLREEAVPGRRVLFPFGRSDRPEEGFIFSFDKGERREDEAEPLKLKALLACLDDGPVLLPEQLKLAAQMKLRYGCTYGSAASAMLPSGSKLQLEEELKLTEEGRLHLPSDLLQHWQDPNEAMPLADLQRAGFGRGELRRYEEKGWLLLSREMKQRVKAKTVEFCHLCKREEAAILLDEQLLGSVQQEEAVRFLLNEGEASVADLLQACGINRGTLRTLQKKNLLSFTRKKQSEIVDASEETDDLIPIPEKDIKEEDLTSGQKHALEAISRALDKLSAPKPQQTEFLLFGITGSGKTEVYLRACRDCLSRGLNCLILVPEIALTPQMTGQFERCFPGETAVMHSRLSPRQRYDVWERIKDAKARIVIGARSAVFAPLKHLGLIIIDEEQEESYQSDMAPRYHAATIARLRSLNEGAVLLLGSATPSLESYVRCEEGKSTLLRLPERPGSAKLPDTKVIDLREHWNPDTDGLLSRPLIAAMREAFARGEQVLLFLNRRGYASHYLCKSCGESIECPTCSVGMTYHKNRNRLVCHYCGKIMPLPEICPSCGEKTMFLHGIGTQKLEQYCRELFPDITLVRMDQDMTGGNNAHAALLKKFREAGPAVLIGTQMIAKGHDFPRLTVSAIISADQMLARNDIRAAEKAFQLITQTAGRAGRSDLPGQVFIQAFDIDHYALKTAAAQDYEAFVREEKAFRRALSYPPYSAMAHISISSESETACRLTAEELYAYISSRAEEKKLKNFYVGKPSKAYLSRLQGRWRWQLQLRALKPSGIRELSLIWAELSRFRLKKDIRISFTLDPA